MNLFILLLLSERFVNYLNTHRCFFLQQSNRRRYTIVYTFGVSMYNGVLVSRFDYMVTFCALLFVLYSINVWVCLYWLSLCLFSTIGSDEVCHYFTDVRALLALDIFLLSMFLNKQTDNINVVYNPNCTNLKLSLVNVNHCF